VLSKKTARKFANDIVTKWRGIDTDNQDKKQALVQADSFLDEGKKFE